MRVLQLAALLCAAHTHAKPRGLGPAGKQYILSVVPPADPLGALSDAIIDVPAATDGAALAKQATALDAAAEQRLRDREERREARTKRAAQRAIARAFNALSEEPQLLPVADEAVEEVVAEDLVPAEALCVVCREARLGAAGCAALLKLAAREGKVREVGVSDARVGDGGLEALLEWALLRGGRRLRVQRDAAGDRGVTKLVKRMGNATAAALEVLELERLALESAGARALADLLGPHASSLKRLSLRGNARLCDAGVASLAKRFVAMAAALEVLDLRNTGCADAGAAALARALRARRDAFPDAPAVAVDVGENLLSGRGVADLMQECTVLDVRRNALGGARLAAALKRAPDLRVCSFAGCALTAPDGEDLVRAAAKSALAVLDVSGNALTDTEARRRAAKKNPKVMQKFAKITSKIAPPPASGDGPAADAVALCAKLLRKGFPSLTWLGLQDVGLTPLHRGLFAASLKKRRKGAGSVVVLEAIANGAAKAPKSKGPVI